MIQTPIQYKNKKITESEFRNKTKLMYIKS